MIEHLSPEQQQDFYKKIQECVNSKIRQSSESELQKEIIKDLKENYELEPKMIRRVITVLYKDSLEEEKQEMDEIAQIVESMKEGNSGT